jgi:hypothetical protein
MKAKSQSVGNVPGGNSPTLLTGLLDDLALRFLQFSGFHPDTAEGGVDEVGQLIGKRVFLSPGANTQTVTVYSVVY